MKGHKGHKTSYFCFSRDCWLFVGGQLAIRRQREAVNKLPPPVFDPYFNSVRKTHSYDTRLSSKMTYVIPKVRTNYGIFNVRFQGAKVWNYISDDIKLLPLKHFKKNLKLTFFKNY